MIRVHRGPEPEGLRAAREANLPALRGKVHAGQALTEDDFGKSYKVHTAEPLHAAQGGKCCYCERPIERAFHDVEHFRPKRRAHRGSGFATDGYWWLAWTWDNLLFACSLCNRSFKKTQFPLEPGCAALVPEDQPPGAERCLLIDPGLEDPLDAIRFRPVKMRGKTRWMPQAKNPRGQATIEVLGLDREGLIDAMTTHANHDVRPKLDQLDQICARGDAREIHAAWQRMLRSLLRRGAPFAALSHDVVDHYLPEAKRAPLRLTLPRPPLDVARDGL